MTNKAITFALLFLVSCVSGSFAATLDFESVGNTFGEGSSLATASPGNSDVIASFWVMDDNGGMVHPIIAQHGGQIFGFQNNVDGGDTPDLSSPILPSGEYFLSNGHKRLGNVFGDYLINFSADVENVSMFLYDYIFDGPDPNTGASGTPGVDTVELLGFNNGMLVDTTVYEVPIDANDGHVVRLATTSGVAVDSVKVRLNGVDIGSGIDQVSFTRVPEPGTCSILLIGMLGLMGFARRK